jgi:A/G-specific adenine glycosylase
MRANIAGLLLQHYVDKWRPLPWRSPPGKPAPDPYRVWLSEVMLQQTTVAAVAPRFERFVERWPTVQALAAAADEDVLSEWAGLGYYARARNLIACAREVDRRGGFPITEAELRKLPGIGDYTAAAIAAIAFGERAVVIDSNVERVAARLRGMERPTQTDLWNVVDELTPCERAGDFAQAMMDLGATICRPREPLCAQCPLSSECIGFASGAPERFPQRKPRRVRPVRFGTAYWTARDSALWLVRRPAKGLLGGMTALPGTDWTESGPEDAALATIRHVFTHFELRLAIEESSDPVGDGWWQPLDRLEEAGLPTLYRKAVEAVLGRSTRLAA